MYIYFVGTDRNDIHFGNRVLYKSALKSGMKYKSLYILSVKLLERRTEGIAKLACAGVVPAGVTVIVSYLCSSACGSGKGYLLLARGELSLLG